MSNSSETEPTKVGVEDRSDRDDGELLALSRLLLGTWQKEVSRLKQRLDDPLLHAKDVSGVLPEAVVLRSGKDGKLATALAPTVEEILKTSVERDPHTLVNALFPVMGPSIRKAILEAIKQLIQSFDQIIGRSFSWQALKWRVEAFRTGSSFGEVVLRYSLLYQVEQVFLIHKETGLLLQHVLAESATAREPDMISGMLTAIQDFVQDSFKTEKQDTLDSIQMGELTIWVEQGPLAVIAGVIRGTPPEKLRLVFIEALENIHLEQSQVLESFEGDATPFERARHHLESCLQAQYKPKRQKASPLLLVALGTLIVTVGCLIFFTVQSHLRWAAYVQKLRSIPGIVITHTEKRSGKHFLAGLRDPLATDPSALLKEEKIDPEQVVFHWEPYYALDNQIILMRARQLLKPPETVSLKFEDGILTATGPASHQWVREFRVRHSIPGVMQFKEQDLIDLDSQELATLKQNIEKIILCFETNTTRLLPDQNETLRDLVELVERAKTLSKLIGVALHIEVIGHADTSGIEMKNVKLSQLRADDVISLLIAHGIDPANVSAIGAGSKKPVREEFAERDRAFNRSTTFKLILGLSVNKEP